MHVTAANLNINGAGTEFARILSDAAIGSTGNAGRIAVSTTRNLIMKRGGAIVTDLIRDRASAISASSGIGVPGTVEIRSSD